MTGLTEMSSAAGSPPRPASDGLTRIELTWIEGKIEYWLRFGREAHADVLDRSRRVLAIAPGSVIAFVRWQSNDHGTILSRLDILRTVDPGDHFQTLPWITPGGEILLRAEGWPKVERVLQLIDAIEAEGIDACDVSLDHWRHVHNRLTVGETPRAYTAQHHRAVLRCRKIMR